MLKLATTHPVKKGFGLLEVLIAAGIFIMVTGGTTSIIRTVLRNNQNSMERTIAYNLAQEGLDLVKDISNNSLRDINAVSGWKYLKYEGNGLQELQGIDLSGRAFELFRRKFALEGEPTETWRWVLEFNNNQDGDRANGEEHIFVQKDGEIRSNKCLPSCPTVENGEIEYIRTIKFYQVNKSPVNTQELFEGLPDNTNFTIRVEVRVTWNGGQNEITASNFLTNWQS